MVLIADEVEFIAFNMVQQIAVDSEDRIWKVDGWIDYDGEPVDIDTVDWVDWDLVKFVTVRLDNPDGRSVWATLEPDEFDGSKPN